MTCYVNPQTGEVFDHTGDSVGNISDSRNWDNSWSGDYPDEVLEVLRNAMDESKPSGYNQNLLVDITTDNIELGTPS